MTTEEKLKGRKIEVVHDGASGLDVDIRLYADRFHAMVEGEYVEGASLTEVRERVKSALANMGKAQWVRAIRIMTADPEQRRAYVHVGRIFLNVEAVWLYYRGSDGRVLECGGSAYDPAKPGGKDLRLAWAMESHAMRVTRGATFALPYRNEAHHTCYLPYDEATHRRLDALMEELQTVSANIERLVADVLAPAALVAGDWNPITDRPAE
jgi:hypothetical protein